MMKRNRKADPLALPSSTPIGLEVERAEASWIEDVNGKRYIDLISGVAVSPMGHSHPRILQAVREQAEKHLHVMVYGEYRQSPQEALARKLSELLPPSLDSIYFLNSGTEANEAAMKLVKAVTGRTELLSFEGAYHGSSQGSLSISDHEERKRNFRPLLPGTRRLPWNDVSALKAIDERCAAVFLETVQGDAGVRIPDPSFMKALRKRCDETGALLVLDEIQCGMGRSGEWWAFEHYGIEPDILTSAKALGGGLPLGALIANDSLLKSFREDPPLGHITSTGGHPLSCAAGLASIEAMLEEKVLKDIEDKGNRLERILDHSAVRSVRRKGLMLGFDLKDRETAERAVQLGREEGVLLFGFLSRPEGVRVAPPLNIRKVELDEACLRIGRLLERL